MPREISLSIANVGDSCYLQDHHNRKGECLLYCGFGIGDSVAEIADAIRHDLLFGDNRIPARAILTETELRAIAIAVHAELLSFDCDESFEDSWIDIQILARW